MATGAERKGVVGEVPRKTQQHVVRTCGWQGCLAGSGGLQSKAERMPILGLGRLREQRELGAGEMELAEWIQTLGF